MSERQNLFGEEMRQRIAHARAMHDRGLESATIHAATEPKVTRRVVPFAMPPRVADIEAQYGTQEQWLAYMRGVHSVPPWADVESEYDIVTHETHARFVWWEIETWVEREGNRR